MSFETRLRILVCSRILKTEFQEAVHLREILGELKKLGYAVVETYSIADASTAIYADAALGCLLLEWGEGDWRKEMDALIRLAQARGLEAPVFLLVGRQLLEDVPIDVMNHVNGCIYPTEDIPDFVAKNLSSHVKIYAETLKTPFFGAMLEYADAGNHMWTCPGHNGGIFHWKSSIGRLFAEHMGEAVFRSDLDNSSVELGDLLIPEGPAAVAQKEAAKIFGAERTYFVLNGTSASNKIALGAIVAQGDLVLFDRNNHKSAHHGALVLAGGIPVYLETERNHHGLMGPIDYNALDETVIREKIKTHPLITDELAWLRKKPFRAAIINQCTYDGTIYNVHAIYEKLSPLCDYILFDEAWGGFMKFHPLFQGRFAMGLKNMGPEDAAVIATQSTHKQLAGFSQASQIHVRDSHAKTQKRHVPHQRFNDSFMMHSSTSPFYPLFASLDVGAQMMKGRAGEVLWDDCIRMGIKLRKKIRALAHEFAATATVDEFKWFFDPFVPDFVEFEDKHGTRQLLRWESVPTDRLAIDSQCWDMTPRAAWHGFPHMVSGYVMTDPNKLTLLTPGISSVTGEYEAHGVPAAIVAQYLRANKIVAEKHDFNSLLFLLTPGMEAGKAGTLLSALVSFKKLHDTNADMFKVIPEFAARYGARYAGIGLYDFCQEMHDFYREHNVATLQKAKFRLEHLPAIAMSPQAASQKFIRNEVEYLPISGIKGRIAATLAVAYPPGVGMIVPGERYDERAQPVLDYLAMLEKAANLFPGFENEIQGFYREIGEDGQICYYTYVVDETQSDQDHGT
ncbi:amino acid decarboxylase [Acidocella aquatica]|uniref:Amino acid decarboxylase n=1 Tax=Acidocella aquatica TaxID=1922313 RepID=A0ABQ6A989_9PROT|nr:Orn/Lys/Arg decarboxylase N-terminal domain-containing protein [Acidocella aquatica]GLR66783.1 amino acid decarboxylase [Acidocella aquatica]